jgi:FkbM family methyltransferase
MTRRSQRSFEEFVEFVKELGFLPETVIDVGVCYGTPELLNGFPNAYHILFEPVVELEERMKIITKKYRGEYHMVALGEQSGNFMMAVPEGNIQGSTLAVDAHVKDVREVKVETLDGVLSGRDIPEPILLKTDCQGFDLSVMKGGMSVLEKSDIVVMEVNMFHPAGNNGLPDFGEIVTWMRDKGFSVYDIISYQTRPFDHALGYVDLVFTKTNGVFRAQHRWA